MAIRASTVRGTLRKCTNDTDPIFVSTLTHLLVALQGDSALPTLNSRAFVTRSLTASSLQRSSSTSQPLPNRFLGAPAPTSVVEHVLYDPNPKHNSNRFVD
ncbi:hypothetical protein DPSP01_001832 [Paraphaeosphaeria sporulosa]